MDQECDMSVTDCWLTIELQDCGKLASMASTTRVISTKWNSTGVNTFCWRSMTSSDLNSPNVSQTISYLIFYNWIDSKVLTYISCLRMKYFTCNIRSHNFQDVLSSLLLMESYRMYKIIVFISVKIASFSTMSKRIQISWSNNVHSSLTRWPFFMRCSFFTKKHRFLQVPG